PPYFDVLIDAFRRGDAGRAVHLGYWDDPMRPAADFERAQARLNEVLLDAAELRSGQAILDVGCGLGATLEQVDARHARMRLVGVNIDPRQLAICRELAAHRENTFEWVDADACA